MSYRNPWITAKIAQLRADISSLESNPNFLRLGAAHPHTVKQEIAWQQIRINLLESVDRLSYTALGKKIKTLYRNLDPALHDRVAIGPYGDLDEETFRKLCNIEMLEAALAVHPKKAASKPKE